MVTSVVVATGPPREGLLRVPARVVRAMRAHNAFEASAGVAFWFFLSLVPLLVLAGFLVGQVARTRGVNALVGPLLDVIPSAAEGIVHDEVERLARASASSLAPLGAVGYLWTASSGLQSLMRVCETAAQANPRPWWKQRGIALGFVVLGLAVACLLALVLVEIESRLFGHSHHSVASGVPKHSAHQGLHAPHGQLLAALLMLGVGGALLGAFYRAAVGRPPRTRRRVWPGTFTAVVFWLIVSWAFGAYAVSVSAYALYYGSLAAVAVLLVWLYLTSLSLVLGAEVNADLERVDSRAPRTGRVARR